MFDEAQESGVMWLSGLEGTETKENLSKYSKCGTGSRELMEGLMPGIQSWFKFLHHVSTVLR
jgi:hypothetical protein